MLNYCHRAKRAYSKQRQCINFAQSRACLERRKIVILAQSRDRPEQRKIIVSAPLYDRPKQSRILPIPAELCIYLPTRMTHGAPVVARTTRRGEDLSSRVLASRSARQFYAMQQAVRCSPYTCAACNEASARLRAKLFFKLHHLSQ